MSIRELRLDENGHWLVRKGTETVTVINYPPLPPYVLETYSSCASCDTWPRYEVAGDAVRVIDPCPYPDGITSVVEVAFPSGRIIVTDDLRPVFNWRDEHGNDSFASYNTALGQHQAILEMAKQGCAYGPVGNTCPSLYRLPAPGKFVIASPAYSESEDDYGDDEFDLSLPGAEKLASICTDLWAYSIADYELWRARGGDPSTLDWSRRVLDIAPGTYRFTHHTNERAFDHDADELIFANIEKID